MSARSSNPNSNPQAAAPHDLLLTPKSLALSLSPPRAPPFGSAQRAVLTTTSHHGIADVRQLPWSRHYRVRREEEEDDDKEALKPPHEIFRQRLHRQLQQQPRRRRGRWRPHPHLAETSADALTRTVGRWWSVPHQNQFRDRGTFRAVADTLVTASVPVLALTHPLAAYRFWQLSRHDHVQELSYGPHPLQRMDLFLPPSVTQQQQQQQQPERLIFFCHGGAWGSGQKWMYRLVADPYLRAGWAVAIPGYRTYPDGKVCDQVQDLELALAALQQQRPTWFPYSRTASNGDGDNATRLTIMGHSSGAHIALLMLVERAREQMLAPTPPPTAIKNGPPQQQQPVPLLENKQQRLLPDSYIGLSGPYDISHHFDYEAGRGVEELSPMKPANGSTRHQFRRHSPAPYLRDSVLGPCLVSQQSQIGLPLRSLLVHGMEDDTVPWTATAEAATVLRSCGVQQVEEWYIPETGHQDLVLQIMLGGPARDATIEWLRQPPSSHMVRNPREEEDPSCHDAATRPTSDTARQRILLQSKL